MEVAAKGLGVPGDVKIPVDICNRLVPGEAISAMRDVEVPTKVLPDAEFAMVQALEQQGHPVPIADHVPGGGLQPRAPIFVIPKTQEKCSFIFNC